MRELFHENEYMTAWIENGIIQATYKPHLREITLDITKKNVRDRLEASKGLTRPLLIDMGKVVSVDKASRDYLSEGDGTKYLSATAILVKNQITKYLANLFIHLDSPKIPTKFFTKKEEALRWLETYKFLS